MRARWVFHDLAPELPGVGMATVASWWPRKYWLVSTIQLDVLSAMTGSSQFFPSVKFIQPTLVDVGRSGFLVAYDQKHSVNEPLIYRTERRVPYGKAVPAPDKFVTQIFRCDRTGNVKSFGDLPLFEREYSDFSKARTGHKETVDLLAQGRLLAKV